MDFNEIVIRGFCDSNNNKNLSKYFAREFKIAKANYYYDADDFFNGLKSVTQSFKENCESQKNTDKHQINNWRDNWEIGQMNTDNLDPSFTHDEHCKMALAEMDRKTAALNVNNYKVKVDFKNNTYGIPYSYIETINNYILAAEEFIRKDTDSLTTKPAEAVEEEFDTNDKTNPLVFDNTLLTNLHREFNNNAFLIPIHYDDFKNSFRKNPTKIQFQEGLTVAAICYIFGQIEHKNVGVSNFPIWMKKHIGNNNYNTKKKEFEEYENNFKNDKRNNYSLTTTQRKVEALKRDIDNRIKLTLKDIA